MVDDNQKHEASKLGPLVEQEARRMLSEQQLQPDPALVAEGWERRFMTDAQRAEEAIKLYSDMGYEVLSVPVQPQELSDDCDGCRVVVMFRFQTIYTRKKT